MKTIFTLFASLFMSVAVFAAKTNSILTIKSADQSVISVTVDGQPYEVNDNSIMIQGLQKGNHAVKVYREINGGFFKSKKRYELLYNASVSIKNNTHTFITIERNGYITKQENKIKKDYVYNDGRGGNYQGGQWGGYDNHSGYGNAMSDREFSSVLKEIDKEWLESNKLKSSLQIVKSNLLTAAQVREMLLLFSFENNKLELAKQAYNSTIDKRNYDMIYEVFSFNNSKSELDRYIRTNR